MPPAVARVLARLWQQQGVSPAEQHYLGAWLDGLTEPPPDDEPLPDCARPRLLRWGRSASRKAIQQSVW